MAERTPTYDDLAELVRNQAEEIVRLRQRVEDLERQLREAHRQNAPFRRRETLKKPPQEKKAPGRPPGHPGQFRTPPESVDHEHNVPLSGCPHCSGPVSGLTACVQFIEEIVPARPVCTKVTTWKGTCSSCGEVHSRHPLQTTDATGAAGTHLGPRAQAVAVSLVHHSGLTLSRACGVLKMLWGLSLSRGGLAQLLQRAGRRVATWRDGIAQQIRKSSAVYADETSWYVGEPKWWLWIFTTPEATLYRIETSRGGGIVLETLGPDFSGTLVSDCLSSYDPLEYQKHKCLSHHLRALSEQAESLRRRGIESQELLLWKIHLQDVIATWKGRAELGEEGYAAKLVQLVRGQKRLLGRAPPHAEEVAFLNRMKRQAPHLLGCLRDECVEPTNNRAERDLRPAVISRKLSCGNRTVAGKRAWETLRTVTVTATKQGLDLVETLAQHLALAPQAR